MGSKFVDFAVYVALLIVLLGLINMTFNLHRFAFIGEFLILLVLMLIALIVVVGMRNEFAWSWKLLKVFFALAFLDMLLVYLLSPSMPGMFLAFLFAAVAGFFIALFNVSPKKEAAQVKKTYKPGKYIASSTGTKFHAPKCYWAKKVKKENAVWFNSKEDAKKMGYKADDCVK
ncbi:hypothetical protein HYU50_01030 [Candidatus Woesearchaeota archaeon]|nr:hypothetical protein [Candidatus Woesearchaeota archaeon]